MIMTFEITKIGERGQVVIPQTFRDEMHVEKGEKFMVLRRGDTLILKRLVSPSKQEIEELFRKGHEHAKKHGLTEKDMWDAIARVRAKKARESG